MPIFFKEVRYFKHKLCNTWKFCVSLYKHIYDTWHNVYKHNDYGNNCNDQIVVYPANEGDGMIVSGTSHSEGNTYDYVSADGAITISVELVSAEWCYTLIGNEEYKRIALAAADTLATLYNKKVGTILSWPRHVKDYGGHNTIMDNMINLELLFWATKNGGSQHLKDIAISHADTTMRYHFRPDGSCYHVAVYDTLTGNFLRGQTHQGYSDSSMWSRGQSWLSTAIR